METENTFSEKKAEGAHTPLQEQDGACEGRTLPGAGNIGRSALIVGGVSGISTTILVLLAEFGRIPPAAGFLLGALSSTGLVVVFLQVLLALFRQRRHLGLALVGLLLALLPLAYAVVESMGNAAPVQG